jgi:hypothetical protein
MNLISRMLTGLKALVGPAGAQEWVLKNNVRRSENIFKSKLLLMLAPSNSSPKSNFGHATPISGYTLAYLL